MRRWLLSSLIIVLSIPSFAANHYICPGASGANTGADWTNAYTGIGGGAGNIAGSAFVRGDTYFVANGQVTSASSTVTINPAVSGVLVVTIQKATDASHGTNTGWTNGGTGTCNSNQAVYGPLQFSADYITFTGVTRGSGTGNISQDWRTSYGFYVNNNNGSNAPVNANWALRVGNTGSNIPQNHVSIEYTKVNGSNDTTGLDNDGGIQLSGGASTGNYVAFNYVYGVGTNDAIDCDSCSSFIEEYNWVQFNEVTPNNHSDMIAIRCWNGGVNNGIDIRYNVIENSNSTAMIATPCVSDIKPTNWGIYGNLFIYDKNAAELPTYTCNNPASGNQTECGNQGFFNIWNFTTWTGYLVIANNTITSVDRAMEPAAPSNNIHCGASFAGVSNVGTTMGTVLIENNIFHNCVNSLGSITCPTTSCTTFTYDYNSYYNTVSHTDSSPHVDIQAGNPFVNYDYTATCVTGTNCNWQLASDTMGWDSSVTSTLAAVGTDLTGKTRTSSRGALQFGGLVFSPTVLAFGNQTVNITSTAQTITLTNNSGVTLNMTSVALTTGTQFAISANTCTGAITNGSNCTTSVTFTPTSTGAKSDTVVYTDDGTGSPQSVAVSGVGIVTQVSSGQLTNGAQLVNGGQVR